MLNSNEIHILIDEKLRTSFSFLSNVTIRYFDQSINNFVSKWQPRGDHGEIFTSCFVTNSTKSKDIHLTILCEKEMHQILKFEKMKPPK